VTRLRSGHVGPPKTLEQLLAGTIELEDLTVNERAQFAKAVQEGDSGTQEWATLMWMVTANSWDSGDAYRRREAVRELYARQVRP